MPTKVKIIWLHPWRASIAQTYHNSHYSIIAGNPIVVMAVVLELVISIGQGVTKFELISTMGFSAMFTFHLDNTKR